MAAKRYLKLMFDLLAARQINGDLSDNEESRRAEELDEQWSLMTDAEQVQVEAVLALIPTAKTLSVDGRS